MEGAHLVESDEQELAPRNHEDDKGKGNPASIQIEFCLPSCYAHLVFMTLEVKMLSATNMIAI